jgi:hypothetical protein
MPLKRHLKVIYTHVLKEAPFARAVGRSREAAALESLPAAASLLRLVAERFSS